MRAFILRGVIPCLLLLLAPPLLAATLEGRWRLVEQYRGSGQANLVAGGPALTLEFTRGEGGLSARIWAGEDHSSAVPWLTIVADCGPLPVTVDELTFLPGERGVQARYRLSPPGGDGNELEVVERYAIAEGGRALTGTVHVIALKDGEGQGSYVLRRRFERAP